MVEVDFSADGRRLEPPSTGQHRPTQVVLVGAQRRPRVCSDAVDLNGVGKGDDRGRLLV